MIYTQRYRSLTTLVNGISGPEHAAALDHLPAQIENQAPPANQQDPGNLPAGLVHIEDQPPANNNQQLQPAVDHLHLGTNELPFIHLVQALHFACRYQTFTIPLQSCSNRVSSIRRCRATSRARNDRIAGPRQQPAAADRPAHELQHDQVASAQIRYIFMSAFNLSSNAVIVVEVLNHLSPSHPSYCLSSIISHHVFFILLTGGRQTARNTSDASLKPRRNHSKKTRVTFIDDEASEDEHDEAPNDSPVQSPKRRKLLRMADVASTSAAACAPCSDHDTDLEDSLDEADAKPTAADNPPTPSQQPSRHHSNGDRPKRTTRAPMKLAYGSA